jgi:hypothetical protein
VLDFFPKIAPFYEMLKNMVRAGEVTDDYNTVHALYMLDN